MNKKKPLNSNDHTTETLQTIDELITALSEGERTTYNHTIHSIKFPANTLDKYSSWSSECYTRNCITKNERFELILLCWEKGQVTQIHDHGGEECWVKVIEGEFRENIYKEDAAGKLKIIKSAISKANEVTYMKDFMGFHSLENIANKRSMSLHLYAKPISNCNVFDEKTKTFINKNLTYCTSL